jgi:site-specific recombinase XerD
MIHQELLPEVQSFLTSFVQYERKLSRQTVLSYRDTIKMFLKYQSTKMRRVPARLKIEDLSYENILAFLNSIEKERGCSIATRNQRLSALKALCRYILFRHPEMADTLSRSTLLPLKKRPKRLRTYLEKSEATALLQAIDQSTWAGQRDHLLLNLALETGMRVSELTGLCASNFQFGKAPFVTIEGKGRKERSIPLEKAVAKELQHWLSNKPAPYIFPSIHGDRMSADTVQYAVKKYAALAAAKTPTLKKKRVTPHVLRHTTAMRMLERGVDIQIIALWLGHEQIETTHIYLSESLALKRKALRRTQLKDIPSPKPLKVNDLSFLDDL